MIDFAVTTERLDQDRIIVAVAGEADMYNAPELERALLAAAEDSSRKVVVDLTNATFIDSTVIGVLLVAHKRLTNGLSVVCGQELAKVFRITGLDRAFALRAALETVPSGIRATAES